MEQKQLLVISVTVIVVLALIIFLIRQNRKDKENLHPGEADSVTETHTEQDRKRDKI
jgi:beta-lactamase regulating signal transducer with metallopeptidase domain